MTSPSAAIVPKKKNALPMCRRLALATVAGVVVLGIIVVAWSIDRAPQETMGASSWLEWQRSAECLLPALSSTLTGGAVSLLPPSRDDDDEAASPPPRAAIVYLIDLARPERVAMLRESLRALDRHFFAAVPGTDAYPVLLFYEPRHAHGLAEHQASIVAALAPERRHLAQFHRVDGARFYASVPSTPTSAASESMGYRRMCRFWAMGVFHEPAVRALEYYWRLDTDLYLLRPIALDPFRTLMRAPTDYLFGAWSREAPEVVEGLWDAVRAFAAARNHSTARLVAEYGAGRAGERYNLRMIYNNFEVVRVALWRDSAAYADLYASALEEGIFQRRWGDAPIRTLALALLFPEARVAQWRGLCYHHAATQWTL